MRITVNGYIVLDDEKWLYDYFGYAAVCPAEVRQALQDLPDGEELVMEVNSPGGSVFAGFEIYSILRATEAATRAEVQSIAASAASTIVAGCDAVMLSPVAQMMIHLPITVTYGDQAAHADSIKVLDSITVSILNGYELRCSGKATRERLADLMAAETWLPAQDAVQLGLADGILYQEGESPILPANIVNAVGGGIRALAAGGGMPDPAALRAEYQRLVAQGAPPAEGQPAPPPDPDPAPPPADDAAPTMDDWRDAARLTIEKTRFL